MKRILTTIALFCMTVMVVMAQPRAIGARLGYNFEVSYQHKTSNGFLEVDAGVTPFIFQKELYYEESGTPVEETHRYGRVQAVVSYNWLRNIAKNFNWYFGLGAGVSWGYGDFFDSPHYDSKGSNFVTYSRLGLPVGGLIGLEYEFKPPVDLSLDWRPMINLFGLRQGDFTSNLFNFALGIRYRF